jgi:hypothetical protein
LPVLFFLPESIHGHELHHAEPLRELAKREAVFVAVPESRAANAPPACMVTSAKAFEKSRHPFVRNLAFKCADIEI